MLDLAGISEVLYLTNDTILSFKSVILQGGGVLVYAGCILGRVYKPTEAHKVSHMAWAPLAGVAPPSGVLSNRTTALLGSPLWPTVDGEPGHSVQLINSGIHAIVTPCSHNATQLTVQLLNKVSAAVSDGSGCWLTHLEDELVHGGPRALCRLWDQMAYKRWGTPATSSSKHFCNRSPSQTS